MMEFKIYNDDQAETKLEELKELQEEKERILNICDKKISEYKTLKEEHEYKFKIKEDEILNLLKGFTLEQKLKETKTQGTYQLASGKLVLKKPAEKIVKVDDFTLIDSYKNSEFVQTKEIYNLAWGELKKTLKIMDSNVIDKNGEIVQGVKIEYVAEEFNVKF